MAFRLLSNLMKAPAVHAKGEILDLPEGIGADLVRRGIAEQVDAPATHLFGQTNEGGSFGGKPIDGAASATPATTLAAPAIAAADDEGVPQVTSTHADAIGEAKDQHGATIQEQQPAPAQPEAQPAEHKGLFGFGGSKAPAAAPTPAQQPTPEQIAADAASVA